MSRKAIILFLFLLGSMSVARAQWEKLPLYRSQITSFVQNKYAANEVFAVARMTGIYKSEDYGNNWSPVITDINKLNWGIIRGFEVSANGKYWMYIHRNLLISSDKGNTWKKISSFTNEFSSDTALLVAHKDGSFFFYPFRITSVVNKFTE